MNPTSSLVSNKTSPPSTSNLVAIARNLLKACGQRDVKISFKTSPSKYATPSDLSATITTRHSTTVSVTPSSFPITFKTMVAFDIRAFASRLDKESPEALMTAARALSLEIETKRSEIHAEIDAIAQEWRRRASEAVDMYSEEARGRFDEVAARMFKTIPKNTTICENVEALVEITRSRFESTLKGALHVFRHREMTNDIRDLSGLADYPSLFPAARAMKRRLIANLGPTNSGKTHAALDALANADTGLYAAPLRLMALEAAERLIEERGIPCAMITGEERIFVKNARHVASTIEMADFSVPVDVAVIDEIQMLSDNDRGWAWTAALMGLPAKTIIMTGSVDALHWIEKITQMTGETVEVRTFERMTPLTARAKSMDFEDIAKGDAVIAFSRAEVMRLREILLANGKSVSVIYGALGPDVRRSEARRFRDGEADVMVATDAIGMGLNLPCRRVVFSTLRKFDGIGTRALTAAEIRQIGGRAGRYGHHAAGEIAVLGIEDPQAVVSALEEPPREPDDIRPYIMPPLATVQEISKRLGTPRLTIILQYFAKYVLNHETNLRPAGIESMLAVADAIDSSGLDLATRYAYLGAPIHSRERISPQTLAIWAHMHARQSQIDPPTFVNLGPPTNDDQLQRLETNAKLLTLYLWLGMRWPSTYARREDARESRSVCNTMIENALRRKALVRNCRQCRSPLPNAHEMQICARCFALRQASC